MESREKAQVPARAVERGGALHVTALRDPLFGGGGGGGGSDGGGGEELSSVCDLNLEVCPGQAAGKRVQGQGLPEVPHSTDTSIRRLTGGRGAFSPRDEALGEAVRKPGEPEPV